MSEMLQNKLALHCAPAIFGLKPANLINCDINDFENLEEELEELNKIFNPKVYFKILKKDQKRILVLVYKKHKLESSLFDEKNYNYMTKFNYPKNKSLNLYLDCLSNRLENKDFPHEIGVFLGYDLDDIIDFQLGNKECLYTGYWKVYSNIEAKLKIFNKYTKCKNMVTSLINKGYSLQYLIK